MPNDLETNILRLTTAIQRYQYEDQIFRGANRQSDHSLKVARLKLNERLAQIQLNKYQF